MEGEDLVKNMREAGVPHQQSKLSLARTTKVDSYSPGFLLTVVLLYARM